MWSQVSQVEREMLFFCVEENSSPKIAVFFHYIEHFGLPLAPG